MNKAWAQPPFDRYIASLAGALSSVECEIAGGPSRPDRGVDASITLIKASQAGGGSVWLAGNGGSGTIADHIACDMVKMRGWRAFALTNPALTTTFANDHAYCYSLEAQLVVLARPGDVVIGMSCSGESENVLLALADTRYVRIGLSGFRADNRLRKLNTNVSFFVPSMKYGEVQIAHLALLHAMVDLAEGAPP
jgi:D-sedoheptulose 7-phosphate isomerase